MEHNLLSTKDADGYGILDAADKRGYKNAYIDYLQKLALDREGSNNSSPSLIVTLTPTGCMMPWSKLGGVVQVYIKFLH
jgi:hypothetical protein